MMILDLLMGMFHARPAYPVDAEYAVVRHALKRAGLNEEELREMDPDDRVVILEQAKLDPYDYIYLAC